MVDELVFVEQPAIEIATNTFFCRIPIRYKDEPIIEVLQEVSQYQPQIAIFHPDGTKLGRVKGARLFLTEQGKNAGLKLRHPANATICELDGKTLFELHRDGAAAIALSAELYTNDGGFLRFSKTDFGGIVRVEANDLKIGGLTAVRNTFRATVGIQIGPTTKPLPTAVGVPLPDAPG